MKTRNYHNSLLDGRQISEEHVSVLNATLTEHTEFVLHKHEWGQLNVINTGLMEININNEQILVAPWQYAVWLPPGVLHSSYNEKNTEYCSVSIPRKFCHRLSATPCIIEISDIVRAIINDLLRRNIDVLHDEKDLTLSKVIIDQLEESSKRPAYLPTTDDKFIRPILDYLHKNPGDTQTLQQWGEKVFASEKTLSRRFHDKLHMSFREWRAHLRFLHSLPLLKSNMTIQEIAWRLGYGNSSSFIIMFMKISGTTPERYRKTLDTHPE